MNAIASWNRLHNIQIPAYASRYGATITKAFSLAKLYSDEPAPAKTDGRWAWGETRARVLAVIQAGPRRPKEIVEELGLPPNSVYVTLNRLVKDGLVLHVGHQYLAAQPLEGEVEVVTPDDVMMDLDYLDAEYAAAVAARMFYHDPEVEAIEDIEAPLMFTRPASAVIKATMPDFDDYLEPELVKDATDASRLDCTDAELEAVSVIREPDYSKVKHYSLAALKREARAKKRANRFNFLECPLDVRVRQLNAMDQPPLDEDTNPF